MRVYPSEYISINSRQRIEKENKRVINGILLYYLFITLLFGLAL